MSQELIDESREIATVPAEPPSHALLDFRQAFMNLPVEVMQVALAEYGERRRTFREWLRSQLVEGLHYGYPPGCEPKIEERNGEKFVGVWNNKKNGFQWVPFSQWTPKPSFYKAGADFVCDLLGLIDTYEADMNGWTQLGAPVGTFVLCCKLYPKGADFTPENCKGEGMGVRKVGQKGGDENNALKMAKKSSKVDAVLNAFGLADLFTQDLEDPPAGPPQHDNPEVNAAAAKADPRTNRAGVTTDQVAEITQKWRADYPDLGSGDFALWVRAVTKRDFQSRTLANWTQDDVKKCLAGLGPVEDENEGQ